MAILFLDGFDYAGNSWNFVSGGKWGTEGSSGFQTSNTVARTGTYSGRATIAPSTCTTKALPAVGGIIVGVAFQVRTAPSGTQDFLQVLEGATVHIALAITTGGFLVIKRGATVLATGTTALAINSWYYLELKAIIHDTTGSYEVRIDGVTEAALTNAGPTDTRNVGATGQWDRVLIASGVSTISTYFDDMYICDTNGAAPRNTFLGALKIETLLPQTDAVAAGSNAGLTPSTGTDHGALVDEAVPNTTDYNSSPTVGLKDTYNYPAMTLSGTVVGIQTSMYIQKSDAAVRQVCPVVRTASVDNDGTNVSPTTGFLYSTQVWEQDPNAGAPIEWTVANIATIQAGMKVTV